MTDRPDPDSDPDLVHAWLLERQDRIRATLQAADGQGAFREETWERPGGGGGRGCILEDGAVFERVGVNVSRIRGERLPPSASAVRPELAGRPFEAMGLSLVSHPRNPYAPTSHLNVRFFSAGPASGSETEPEAGEIRRMGRAKRCPSPAEPGQPSSCRSEDDPGSETGETLWWFGGGFDLTPCYGFEEDAIDWHRAARAACEPFGAGLYETCKRACDQYFFIRHRNEPRGIGGLFFDDFNAGGFAHAFAFARSVVDHYLPAYLRLVERRRATPYGKRERSFQIYRRGRYVEFNLLQDRGTLFGIQSGGRAESILMSMPPLAGWRHDWRPEPGTPEADLYERFLVPRDWLAGDGAA